ncbi:GDSL esterase/lipase [Actinidia chinensis var. chinensis]|uniref:GDSL esterase/lipase n=1 Tax=Actinidia chinensis var. chinensis TaxID=1590841 RepID=A0A2R6RXA4_ACTCC|nr:GDSL esterase/lipase [Actinidia chinensis var. chinensis]
MSSYKQHFSICVHLFLFMLIFSSRAQDQPPLKTRGYLFRSVYTFGDSFVDPGNNNYIQAMSKSNFPPYGTDFVNQMSTGRFSNGRLFPDFLAYYLGTEKYQQPYLDPTLNLRESVTAVSFASATSGYDPITANLTKAIPMSEQLENFKQYKVKLQKKIGRKRAEDQIKKALFYVNAGSDDFALSYFGDGKGQTIRQKQYRLPDYEQFLLQLMAQFIQGLSDQGARKIAVTGLPPLGCIPVGITLLPTNLPNASPKRSCLDYVNSVSRDFNVLLQNQLKAMQSKLSKVGTKIGYIDFEQPLLDVIQNPKEYGFTQVNNGCCGSGLYEIGTLCNATSPVCADASEYVFWDAAHPTERTYFIIFTSNLGTINHIITG